MPTFQVTLNPPALKSERGSEQAISVTVTNTLDRPATARVTLRTGPSSPSAWVTPPSDNLGRYPGRSASQQFTFVMKVPADAPAGSYSLLFDVVDTDLPDDHFGTSAPLSFVLAPLGSPAPTPRPKPRWWILVAAAVLVIGLGFVVWKAFFDQKGGMPDLRGKPFADVTLDSTRFSVLRYDTLSRDTSKYKPGIIVAQSIRPGSKLSDSVNMLVLSVQQTFIHVPQLLGLTLPEAATLLGHEGLLIDAQLKLVRTQTRPDSIPGANKVFQVNPPIGTLVGLGQRVAVKILAPFPCNPTTGVCARLDGLQQFIDTSVRRVNLNAFAERKP